MADKPKKEQALPVNFGKRLAHTDKVVRDRSFKTLKKWLTQHPDLDRLEYMKLWKGLYFCMWMADKRPVQQELAVNIALLANDVPAEKRSMWFDTFWETMQTNWEKLDVHRVNKYMLFTRIVVAEAFKLLRLAGWPHERLRAIGDTFTRVIPGESAKATPSVTSLGFFLQFIRVFWAELLPQVDQKPTPEPAALMQLLEPFCALAEASPVRNLVVRIHEHLFRQAPKSLQKVLADRLLAGAPSAAFKSNREALYETVDFLERELRLAASAAAKSNSGSMSPLTLPRRAASAEEAAGNTNGAKKKKTRRSKRKKKCSAAAADDEAAEDDPDDGEEDAPEAGPSPLALPKAALPIAGGTKKRRKGKIEQEDGPVKKQRKKKQSGK